MVTWTSTPSIDHRGGNGMAAPQRDWFRRVIGTLGATAHDRERRWEAAWRTIAYLVVGVSIWQGAGYAFASEHLKQSDNWRTLTGWLPGGLRTHGYIMLAISVALLHELWRGKYRPLMLWVLRAMRFWYTVVALCWALSWQRYGVAWGGPAWWVLLAALTIWLARYRPILGPADEPAPRAHARLGRRPVRSL